MVTRTITAGSVYGRSPECFAWVKTHTDRHQGIHTAVIDTDAQTLTISRFHVRDGVMHHDRVSGGPEEDTPEVVPLRTLPDVLDVLAAVERHEAYERARREERRQEVATAP